MDALNHYSGIQRSIFLLVGAFCLWDARRALSTGRVWLNLGSIRRSDFAPLFWLCVALNIAVGMFCLLVSAIGANPW